MPYALMLVLSPVFVCASALLKPMQRKNVSAVKDLVFIIPDLNDYKLFHRL